MALRGGTCAGHLGNRGSGHAGPGGPHLRAEITDAAMAERAECVMLNKVPFIDDAITMLADIITGWKTPKRGAAC